MKLRLLPTLGVVCTLLLGLKIVQVGTALMSPEEKCQGLFSQSLLISDINAQPTTPEASPKDAASAPPPAAAVSNSESPPPASEEAGATKEEKGPASPPPAEEEEKEKFTQDQLDILESLSQRRKELEDWERTISIKENVLRATELRIEAKMTEMRDLEAKVKTLIDRYNEKDDQKIMSLVKIYESMKPVEAARILEQLEISVVLQVINKMKEAKAALILAQMDPKLAKDITLQYAMDRKLKSTALPQ